MKKIVLNVLLSIGVIVPVTMLFWPFVSWGDAMSLILRIIPPVSAQILFCRIAKHKAVEAIPFLLTGVYALWATDLYLTFCIDDCRIFGTGICLSGNRMSFCNLCR